ncbi:hypothetical protein EDI_213840 [Entamoeba dispar SAW760]|uniref:Uncharacterized protein n=1 Tax=Entamoeba dispar (strain ATCC PRA-260 / SAW760) TaxID=370354 RepID=B0E861_ENTDS|nr:uncharacterized protein EDI_213840 [Entamoeba dispar SAW760]EDR29309.1 hypothetical protein EDI_213840 [Entamoeba dispar SAW760]|eukprot:EDR29309.1 hypothetical protein EDI_213840 [Entamoeba dispar SAW760]
MNSIQQLRQLIQELCCVFDERNAHNIKDVILDTTTEKILKSFVSVDELNSYGILRFRILSNIVINKQPLFDRLGIFILTFNDNNIRLLKEHLRDKVYWKESIIFTQTGVLNETIVRELSSADIYNVINNIECVDINWKYVTPQELECQQYFHINQKTPLEMNKNFSLMMTLYNQNVDNNNTLSERINIKCGPTHQIFPLFQPNPLFNDEEFHPLITRIVAERKMIFNESFELILGTLNEDFNSNKMIIWINGGFTPFEEIELHKTLLKMKSSTEVILGGSQLLNTELYYQWLSNE